MSDVVCSYCDDHGDEHPEEGPQPFPNLLRITQSPGLDRPACGPEPQMILKIDAEDSNGLDVDDEIPF